LITVGRCLTQGLKIQGLGLTDLFDDILISEGLQSDIPDDKRFVFLQYKYAAAKRFIYIGVNIKKDFVAPTKLGWLSIC
ncbi:HAD family hydrolase, partial [Neisseria sp. P0014.S008]